MNSADVVAVLTLVLGAVVAFWFSFTLNDIRKQLKTLVDQADKQIEFLDYISDGIDSVSKVSSREKK